MTKLKNIIGVIPARYNSTRLPGKPLRKILGKTMLLRVCEQAEKSRLLTKVIVATDDERIFHHMEEHNKVVVMTSSDIKSGTDRCWEAVKDTQCDMVVNIQGDEPLIDPEVIDRTIECLLDSENAVCSTPIKQINDIAELKNENTVKVVKDIDGNALYFSRSAIPFERESSITKFKHIGLYCFDYGFLGKFVKWNRTPNEVAESLEQLRILENGYKIKCVEVDYDSIGVDTESDIEIIESILSKRGY